MPVTRRVVLGSVAASLGLSALEVAGASSASATAGSLGSAPEWRMTQFVLERFGGSDINIRAAVKSVFTSLDTGITVPRNIKLNNRRQPGATEDPGTDPSALDLLTELDEWADGIAEHMMSFTSLP